MTLEPGTYKAKLTDVLVVERGNDGDYAIAHFEIEDGELSGKKYSVRFNADYCNEVA